MSHYCLHCLEKFDLLHPFVVQCKSCAAQGDKVFYHPSCWQTIQTCHRCHGTEVRTAFVPSLPSLTNLTRKPILPRPNKKISILRVPGPLLPLNPVHHILRLWWILFDTPNAQLYKKQHGENQARQLDWWIASFWVFLIGFSFLFDNLAFETLPRISWLGYYIAGSIGIFAITCFLGSSQGGLYRFLGLFLLGAFSTVFLWVIGGNIAFLLNLIDFLVYPFQLADIGLHAITPSFFVPAHATFAIIGISTALVIATTASPPTWLARFLYLIFPLAFAAFILWLNPAQAANTQYILLWFLGGFTLSSIFIGVKNRFVKLLLVILLIAFWYILF